MQLVNFHIHFLFDVEGVELEVVVGHVGYVGVDVVLVVVHVDDAELVQVRGRAVQLHAGLETVHLLERGLQVRLLHDPRLVSGRGHELRADERVLLVDGGGVAGFADHLLVADRGVAHRA